jgi:hypothetical protein
VDEVEEAERKWKSGKVEQVEEYNQLIPATRCDSGI